MLLEVGLRRARMAACSGSSRRLASIADVLFAEFESDMGGRGGLESNVSHARFSSCNLI